jgi:protoporphyrinogen oxidase
MQNVDEENKTLSRRSFVVKAAKLAALAAGANWLDLLAARPAQGQSKSIKGAGRASSFGSVRSKKYKYSRWLGDDFAVGHQMRNGDLPDIKSLKADGSATDKVDFVIVGGGIAALAAAYKLKSESFILLEQYDRAGGQSISGSHNGFDYALGAAYFVDNDGPAGQLTAELGLKPACLDQNMDAFWLDKRWQRPQNFAARGLKQLKEIVSPIAKSLRQQTLASFDSALFTADNTPFSKSLTALDGKFRAYLDCFLKSSTCGSADDISLLAGADMTAELFSQRYVLPGGNGAISEALIKSIKAAGDKRIKTGTFVWSIQIKDDGATVIYQKSKGGPDSQSNAVSDMVRIDCKHVIICTPPMVTGRILSNVSNQAKGNLFWMRYGSYMVANLLLDKALDTGTFDNFVSADGAFSDMTVAQMPYQLNNQYNSSMGSVLTIYKPWAPGTEGRALLLDGNKSALMAPILKQLTQITGKSTEQLGLTQIVLARWGHAIAVPLPRYYQKLCTIHATNQNSRYSLAHSSLYGVQCLESALEAGYDASKKATQNKLN